MDTQYTVKRSPIALQHPIPAIVWFTVSSVLGSHPLETLYVSAVAFLTFSFEALDI
jgi:hypothetical protein